MKPGTGIVRRALSFARSVLVARKRTGSVIATDRRRLIGQLGMVLAGLALVKTRIAEAVYKMINNVRLWRSPDKTRLVFDVSDAVEHKQFHLSNPSRLVIDVNDARLSGSFSGLQLHGTPINKIRHGVTRTICALCSISMRRSPWRASCSNPMPPTVTAWWWICLTMNCASQNRWSSRNRPVCATLWLP